MRDVSHALGRWWRAGRAVGVATVVGVWNAAPRPVGATMVVGPDGSVVGSLAGGCVEAAVYEIADEVRRRGGRHVHRFGVAADDALSAGLTCGGELDVLVERVSPAAFPQLGDVLGDIAADRPVAFASLVPDDGDDAYGRLVLRGEQLAGSLGDAGLDASAGRDLRRLLGEGTTAVLRYGAHGDPGTGGVGVFFAAFPSLPRLLVFGAIEFASALVDASRLLGYRVTVCDARATFATRARFPNADEVVVEWPHLFLRRVSAELDGSTVICVLTHDEKFDDPLLEYALRLPVGYVGALGSRATNSRRMARLRSRGATEDELGRLHAPIGLDIGARTASETAVSILAEILALRHGRSRAHLSGVDGPIHGDRARQRDCLRPTRRVAL